MGGCSAPGQRDKEGVMIWFITCFAVIFAMLGGWSWLIAPQMDKKPDFTALSGFDYAHRGLHKLSDGVP